MSIFIFEVETEDFGAWFVLIRANTLLEAEAKVTEKFPNDNVFAGEEISFDQDGVSQLIDPPDHPSSRTLGSCSQRSGHCGHWSPRSGHCYDHWFAGAKRGPVGRVEESLVS